MLIILDGVKDHSPSPFWEEDRIRDMEGLGKSIPEQERKLENGVEREEGVVPYLTRLTQIKDELRAVGFKTED